MGGKSGGSDISVDPSEVFPGLVTPSFSLLRSQRPRTPGRVTRVGGGRRNIITRGSRIPFEGGTTAVPNIFGRFQNEVIRTVNTGGGGGQGPFQLTRTGPDPVPLENAILQGLGGIRGGLEGLRGNINLGREELSGIRSRIPEVFANTQSLREANLALREDVEPGFGRLTRTQVEEARNREAQAQGNLREALAARRVLGSSFAQREQQSLGLEFAQEEERIRSESFLAEMDTQQSLIQQAGQLIQLDQQTIAEQAALLGLELGLNEQEADLFSRQVQTFQVESGVLAQRASRELQELAISGNIINGVTAAATQLAGLQAQAAAERASGLGQLIGSLGGAVIGGIFGK